MTGPRAPGEGGGDGPHPLDAILVQRIEQVLRDYLSERSENAGEVHPRFAEATGTLSRFVLGGGKRIRPSFAWWGWRGAGGRPDGTQELAVLRAISALELVQANALVHDDLMDASATRRGHPTVHVAYRRIHRARDWRGDGERFGAAVAILLGDLALAWADDLFHDAGLPPAAYQRARPVWTGMRTEMLGGQFLDVSSQARGDESVRTALRVDRFKTAAYTVERPLWLGAAMADAPAELVRAYRRFGALLGVAFQLRDDQLGVFGDPAATGKPAGDDLREGKRTLLMSLAVGTARRRGDRAALRVLTEALGDNALTEADVERVRAVLHRLGAPEQVERRVRRLTNAALDSLAGAGVAEPAADRLAELAGRATRRSA